MNEHGYFRYPGLLAGFSWLISISAAVLALALADFGGPPWVFIACGLWLCSFGLPTTLSLVTLSAIWGNVPGLGTPPLWVFVVSVVIVSLAAQEMSFLAAVRWLGPRRAR